MTEIPETPSDRLGFHRDFFSILEAVEDSCDCCFAEFFGAEGSMILSWNTSREHRNELTATEEGLLTSRPLTSLDFCIAPVREFSNCGIPRKGGVRWGLIRSSCSGSHRERRTLRSTSGWLRRRISIQLWLSKAGVDPLNFPEVEPQSENRHKLTSKAMHGFLGCD